VPDSVGESKIRKSPRGRLGALRHYPQNQIGEGLLEIYPRLTRRLQTLALNLLCRRLTWGRLLVEAVDAGQIDPKDVTLDQLRQLAAMQDADLNRQLAKRWGKIQADSPAEKRNAINRLKLVLVPSGVVGRDAKGNVAEGKKAFQTACAVCHKLLARGTALAPISRARIARTRTIC